MKKKSRKIPNVVIRNRKWTDIQSNGEIKAHTQKNNNNNKTARTLIKTGRNTGAKDDLAVLAPLMIRKDFGGIYIALQCII